MNKRSGETKINKRSGETKGAEKQKERRNRIGAEGTKGAEKQ